MEHPPCKDASLHAQVGQLKVVRRLTEPPQRVLNRFGQQVMIDLAWTGSVVEKPGAKASALPRERLILGGAA
jgi:hypothetical protein